MRKVNGISTFHLTRVPETHFHFRRAYYPWEQEVSSGLAGQRLWSSSSQNVLWESKKSLTSASLLVKEHLFYHCSQTLLCTGLGEGEVSTSLFSYFLVHPRRSQGDGTPCTPCARSRAFLTVQLELLFCFLLLWFLPSLWTWPASSALRMNSIRKHTGEGGKRILAKSQNENNNTEIGMEHSPISPGCWEN